MKTYLVKVEYKTPRGSHMTVQEHYTCATPKDALCIAFNNLVVSGNKQVARCLRMDVQPVVEEVM